MNAATLKPYSEPGSRLRMYSDGAFDSCDAVPAQQDGVPALALTGESGDSRDGVGGIIHLLFTLGGLGRNIPRFALGDEALAVYELSGALRHLDSLGLGFSGFFGAVLLSLSAIFDLHFITSVER